MDTFIFAINSIIAFMRTPLTFHGFTFTLWECFLLTFILSVGGYFVGRLLFMNSDD